VLGAKRAEQPVGLIGDAGAEEERVLRTEGAVAKANAPEAVDDDRRAVLVVELAEEGARAGIVGVDGAVAEVTDQKRVPEGAEARRGDRHPTGRIEVPARDQPAHEGAVGAEDVDEAVARA